MIRHRAMAVRIEDRHGDLAGWQAACACAWVGSPYAITANPPGQARTRAMLEAQGHVGRAEAAEILAAHRG